MAGQASRVNGKKGGRPPGSINDITVERKAKAELIRQRVYAAQDAILNGLISTALGVSYLYKIEKTEVVGSDGRVTYKREKPELVTSQSEIEEYLAGLIEDNEIEGPGATYYYITTDKPETAAAKELFDRAYGKATQPISGDDDGRPLILTFDNSFANNAFTSTPKKGSTK